ncbi:MAG: energy transducer TonB [bacterium]|nr:energy transducer TonB [bacterium]
MKYTLLVFALFFLALTSFAAKGSFTLKTVDIAGNPVSNHEVKVKGKGHFTSDSEGLITVSEAKIGKEHVIECSYTELYRGFWDELEFVHPDSAIIIELDWTDKGWDIGFHDLFRKEMAQRMKEVESMENPGTGPCDSTNEENVTINGSFPGGNRVLNKYIMANIQYPEEAIDNNEQGKVIVSFIVLEDGTLDNIEIKQSASKSLDEEALRLVRGIPGFIPPFCDGKPVSFNANLPFSFDM